MPLARALSSALPQVPSPHPPRHVRSMHVLSARRPAHQLIGRDQTIPNERTDCESADEDAQQTRESSNSLASGHGLTFCGRGHRRGVKPNVCPGS
eukprot:4144095-Pyramimonas_sp.AAC.1